MAASKVEASPSHAETTTRPAAELATTVQAMPVMHVAGFSLQHAQQGILPVMLRHFVKKGHELVGDDDLSSAVQRDGVGPDQAGAGHEAQPGRTVGDA